MDLLFEHIDGSPANVSCAWVHCSNASSALSSDEMSALLNENATNVGRLLHQDFEVCQLAFSIFTYSKKSWRLSLVYVS